MEWNIVNQPNRRAIRQDTPRVIAIAKVAPKELVTPGLAVTAAGTVALITALLASLIA